LEDRGNANTLNTARYQGDIGRRRSYRMWPFPLRTAVSVSGYCTAPGNEKLTDWHAQHCHVYGIIIREESVILILQ